MASEAAERSSAMSAFEIVGIPARRGGVLVDKLTVEDIEAVSSNAVGSAASSSRFGKPSSG